MTRRGAGPIGGNPIGADAAPPSWNPNRHEPIAPVGPSDE
jgi:hypothetical protein